MIIIINESTQRETQWISHQYYTVVSVRVSIYDLEVQILILLTFLCYKYLL